MTPRQIAIYSALGIGSSAVLMFLLIIQMQMYASNALLLFIFLVVIILIAYLINLFFLQRYIYRKIKLIYKNIHSLKLDPASKKKTIDIDSQIFEEVQQDVSDWARTQQKEIDNLKLLETYRREFIGNVSHELKTPIFNIQGYIHTLLDGALHDEKINTKYLQRSAKNVDRLITIVDDLETISRLESGRLVLDLQKFDQ